MQPQLRPQLFRAPEDSRMEPDILNSPVGLAGSTDGPQSQFEKQQSRAVVFKR